MPQRSLKATVDQCRDSFNDSISSIKSTGSQSAELLLQGIGFCSSCDWHTKRQKPDLWRGTVLLISMAVRTIAIYIYICIAFGSSRKAYNKS